MTLTYMSYAFNALRYVVHMYVDDMLKLKLVYTG